MKIDFVVVGIVSLVLGVVCGLAGCLYLYSVFALGGPSGF
jgi:hypothetical protein